MKHIVIVTDETTENVMAANYTAQLEITIRGFESFMWIYGSEVSVGLVDMNLTVEYYGTTEQLMSLLEDMFPAPTYSVEHMESFEDED